MVISINTNVNIVHDHTHIMIESLVMSERDFLARKSKNMDKLIKNWIAIRVETKIEFDINLEPFVIGKII